MARATGPQLPNEVTRANRQVHSEQRECYSSADRQLIDRREELFQLFNDGPLNKPTIDFAAVDQPIMEAEAMARRGRWIDEHAHLVDEYSDLLHEIDRRVAARTVLWQINPPQDLLAEIGSRSESPNPRCGMPQWPSTPGPD